MHEMSLALRIIEVAESEAKKAAATRISSIEVEVGRLAGVMAEALTFCLDAASRGTMAESAKIVFITTAGSGHCLDCKRDISVDEFPAQCPDCHGFGVTINNGTELKIRSISIDDNEGRQDNV
ncbi:MAG: hydrogenase maturation nickel metallochaperone HypA [Proteobacteria bacterium]|nr:hydrogenase maturation nickel metallochaperone HypA [Desulfobulbaceae bacterium]MBU4151499.1 hydrogenase maturation nickel metallochaperone HypA [Pseudomonadota bacterium]MDP2106665.1 hydrogenase maturation nickel metallochaperone HypA [Desulfobulbaceae bacterium]